MSAAVQKVCPKCGHARAADSPAPAWQCPSCGIAYHKYQPALERVRRAVAPPRAADPAPAVPADGSVWSLVAANLLVVAVALYEGWSPYSLMVLYWAQSVIIGLSNVFRILALDRFSTENFQMNNRAVEPTPENKRKVAFFFALHYGFFHAIYLVFLFAGARATPLFDAWFWLCALVFALNHLWSYRYNRDLDRRGTPNIGTLMFVPYVRIVPMHMTIIFGGMLGGGAVTLVLFGALKTVADVVMHVIEHALLKKVRGAPAAQSPQS